MSLFIPDNVGQRLILAGTMHQGLIDDAAALKITQITAPEMAAEIATLTSINDNYNAGRTAVRDASDAVQALVDQLSAYLKAVKAAVTISFGAQWSVQWVQVGFISPSLALPRTLDKKLTLAGAMIAFLTKQAGYEVADKGVTAAAGTAILTARKAAVATLTNLEKAQVTLDTTWTAAFDALGDTMWSLIKLLQGSMEDDDPRWLDFGLPLPGTISTPGQPQNLAALVDGTGAIIVSCDPEAGAERYRFRMRILGVEANFRLAKGSKEPLAAIPGVLVGQTVELMVQAVKGNLQSVASESILFTVPQPAPATAAIAESRVIEEAAPAYRNGNGHHTNGNGMVRV